MFSVQLICSCRELYFATPKNYLPPLFGTIHVFCKITKQSKSLHFPLLPIKSIRSRISLSLYKCEECNYEDTNEESVLNHTIANHSTYLCDLCEFQTSVESNLNEHQIRIHKRTKHSCSKCSYSFNSQIKLKEHMSKKHQEDCYPCDHCKFKADNITILDSHILRTHPAKSKKDTDIRKLENRQPCNFIDPAHSKDCCDRVPGPPRKYYTQKERLQNGPCRNWMESECQFYELCKFAHISVCHFQRQCRNSENCRYFHYDGSNQNFLCGGLYQKSFLLNSEEFPPLPTRNSF